MNPTTDTQNWKVGETETSNVSAWQTRITENGYPVAYAWSGGLPSYCEKNAAFIVRAVNSHGELLQIAKDILRYDSDTESDQFSWSEFMDRAKEAIAKAEGKE